MEIIEATEKEFKYAVAINDNAINLYHVIVDGNGVYLAVCECNSKTAKLSAEEFSKLMLINIDTGIMFSAPKELYFDLYKRLK